MDSQNAPGEHGHNGTAESAAKNAQEPWSAFQVACSRCDACDAAGSFSGMWIFFANLQQAIVFALFLRLHSLSVRLCGG